MNVFFLCFKFSYVCTFSKTFSLVVFLYFLSLWSGTISISNYELKAYSETLQSSCSVSYMKLKICPNGQLSNWTPTSKTLWFSFNSKVQQVLSDFSAMFPLPCTCSECIKITVYPLDFWVTFFITSLHDKTARTTVSFNSRRYNYIETLLV